MISQASATLGHTVACTSRVLVYFLSWLGHRVLRRTACLHTSAPACTLSPAIPACLGKRSIPKAGFCSSSAGFIPRPHTPSPDSREDLQALSPAAPTESSALAAVNFQSSRRSQAGSWVGVGGKGASPRAQVQTGHLRRVRGEGLGPCSLQGWRDGGLSPWPVPRR